MMNPNLIDLRAEEFSRVRHLFHPGMRVLEIGGGIGYQASLMASIGVDVVSIDVAEPPSGSETYFPVLIYDGGTLPFPDGYFDVVFTSNVLEHIHDLNTTLSEVRRVLKADGVTIHILPTPAWRIWTSLSHYVFIARVLVGLFGGRHPSHEIALARTVNSVRSRSIWRTIKRVLAAGPHGEYPSAISELWYFSRRRWLKLFQENGFDSLEDWPLGIFYTGYSVFPSISIERRRRLACILGSATRVFVLRQAP